MEKDGDVSILLVLYYSSMSQNTTLNIGRWSHHGCIKNNNLSSIYETICDCNHLTHFAILLSPKPQVFDSRVELSLTIIGYIGVSVSLLAMGLTVFTFIALK